MGEPEGNLNDGAEANGASDLYIPDHVLLRRIGSGSYGEVWLARNAMGAYRAVKVVYRNTFNNARPFERELSGIRKFEPISRSHDGFVDVLHVGQNLEDGYFYYVMELGDDESKGQEIDVNSYRPKTLLKAVSQKGQLDLSECVRLGIALSDALYELHRQGLVHRDVKPSNIIFVGNIPKLADIGLVAEVSEARSYVGTEGFIPPEGPGKPSADVFALGKVLYEASTGKDRIDFPELPDFFEKSPDHTRFLEFNAILARACQPEPSLRYQSAEVMHNDLLVLAKGESVRRLHQLERQLARVKRFTGVAAVLFLLLGSVGFHFYREWRTRDEARQRQAGSDVAYGTRSLDSGDTLGALTYFAEAVRLDHRHSEREKSYRLMFASTLSQCPKITQMWRTSEKLRSIRFSPDGRLALCSGFEGVSLFDTRNGLLIRTIDTNSFNIADFSPNGEFLASASMESNAMVWRVSDGAPLLNLSHPMGVYSAEFSPDGKLLVTAADDGHARIYDARTGELKRVFANHGNGRMFARFDGLGERIATGGNDGLVVFWAANTGSELFSLKHGGAVPDISFSPDGKQIVTVCWDRKAYVWDLEKREKILPLLEHDDLIARAEFSPDGQEILTASMDHTARLWRARDHQPSSPSPLLRHSDRVTYASFDREGNQIITSCTDGTVRIWDLAGEESADDSFKGTFCNNGRRFLIRSNEAMQIFDAGSGKKTSEFRPFAGGCDQTRFCENGNFLACMSPPETNQGRAIRMAAITDTSTGVMVAQRLIVPASFTNISCSDNGQYCFVYGRTNGQLWDVVHGKIIYEKEGRTNINQVRFASNNELVGLLVGRRLEVWDVLKSRPAFVTAYYPFPLRHAEFSPDCSKLVVCGADPTLDRCPADVFDVRTGKKMPWQLTQDDGILFACFSPDGARIVTTCEDYTVVIWDAKTGQQVLPTLRHHSSVNTARFSPDGRWIVTACYDGTARIWDAQTGDPITPLFWHPNTLLSGQFVADSEKVIFRDNHARNWIWRISSVNKPSLDLALVSEVMTGDSISLSGPERMAAHHDPLRSWTSLRSAYPRDFSVSFQERENWHRLQASKCRKYSNTNGIEFHLGFLPMGRDLTGADNSSQSSKRF